jgi:hypothetical protein
MTVNFRREQPQLEAQELELLERIRQLAEELHDSVDMAPASPAREQAQLKLEECVMWATKAVGEGR